MKVAWRSSWHVEEAAAIAERKASDATATGQDRQGDSVCFEASLDVPVVLRCPPQETESESNGRASTPCELTVEWSPQPRRCRSLRLELLASARHVELFADGTRRNLLGQQERGEVYLGTFRGVRQSNNPLLFTFRQQFEQQSSEHGVIGSLERLRVKFVSLAGDKRSLQLHALRCIYDAVLVSPPASAMPSTSNGMSALAGLNLTGAGSTDGRAPDTTSNVLALLASAQQSMLQQMEAKIAVAMDAKLAALSQRLALSEQMLFKLHQRVDSADSEQKASVDTLQGRLAGIEASIEALGKLGAGSEDLQQPAE